MQVDAVKTAFATSQRGSGEGLHHLGDLQRGQRHRHAADHRVGNRAGRHLTPCLPRAGRRPRVVDLLQHLHPVWAEPRHQLPVERDAAVVVERDQTRCVGVYARSFERAHPRAASRSRLVVGDQVLPREQRAVRRAHDAVRNGDRAHVDRFEQVLVHRNAQRPCSWAWDAMTRRGGRSARGRPSQRRLGSSTAEAAEIIGQN